MRDREERAASLALRDGGPAPVRRAIDWYRRHDRLHTGDEIAMATNALAAYDADIADGKDALLLCDTKEMADALNRRIHSEVVAPKTPTIGVACGHRVAVGDLIISRRNDPTIPVLAATRNEPAADPVRNGNRWHVYAIDSQNNRIAARRLDDGARAVFESDYLREQITYGYAVTVHSAQGVTADTPHGLLSENTTRAMLYVAITRGRESNAAYLYQRTTGEADHQHREREDSHMARRGGSREAANLMRKIVAAATNRPAPLTMSLAPPSANTFPNWLSRWSTSAPKQLRAGTRTMRNGGSGWKPPCQEMSVG